MVSRLGKSRQWRGRSLAAENVSYLLMILLGGLAALFFAMHA
jgi:hypothetical protein